ncbi:ABC transporter substrate-binding protein [Flavimaricola marinus]|uniref:Putative ABC transporter-binding protein n=1 Tax=Flavimaricola marinus TaxID=1819565 RepID=A0A238LAH8_9RHOB|nr:ABC transporter substrate-binding protein [Flavimaricola marinus]SMY06679.1 putative ABC transporter-binding protein precursor [Flavimaricola marinus]
MNLLSRVASAALLVGLAPGLVSAQIVEATSVPPAPAFDAQGEPVFVNRSDVFEYRALESYAEPDFVAEFVAAGLLPPVAERLPAEPLVYKAGNMPDGPGVYGDVMRHVIGGRPEGWNYIAGNSQGWGGIDIGMFECLTRTGPLFMVNSEDLAPMPNLAKDWEWSEDGMSLVVNLIEGAKWSDGDPFDADDLVFYWDHHVMDPEITPLNGASQGTFGEGSTMEKTGEFQVTFTFTTSRPEAVLYAMAYGTFCPGPSHILAPEHPANSDNSYEDYRNAFPPEYLNFPVMGAWVPVEYRSDDIVVLRRNPYYWKVDDAGNQLPYLNEMHYRLSTWADRDVQAVAGTGDFSNLEQAENFVESLRRAADPDSPARLAFGPRTIGYSMYMNFSGNGWGEPDERRQAIRELNRNADFRMGLTQVIDRVRLGESLVKGPFTAEYPGGIYAGTSFYDADSTVFYPYSLESAAAHFEAAGLTDTDGDGFLNHPAAVLGGANVQVTLLSNNEYATDGNLAEGIVAMMEEAGIQVALNSLAGNDFDATRDAGRYDWMVRRNTSEYITVIQRPTDLAPVGPQTAWMHMANEAGEIDLMDFEAEMVDVINAFVATNDPTERAELMKTYQRLHTENVYSVGLTAYPGALIINKRFSNIPPGAPIFMYNWAEDNIIRERVFVASDAQSDNELHPGTLPGAPGGTGPMMAN